MPLLVFLIGAGAAALAHLAPFPFVLDGLGPAEAVWQMPAGAGAHAIYLTYDDGPNPTATPAVLDVLARERATATFFLIDGHITADTAPLVRRMFADGHTVALHADSRRLMRLAPDALAATLERAAGRIEQLAGARPCRAFRPHGGGRSSLMFQGLARADYVLVGWGWMLWDFDWFRPRDAGRIARRIVSRASPGSIVVIHDGHHKNPRADRRYAAAVTAEVVSALRPRGFTFEGLCDGGRFRGAGAASR